MYPAAERWYVLAHDGKQYGPLSRADLDNWYVQGRLAPHSQLLRQGESAWQWATALYPALVQPQPAPVQPQVVTAGRAVITQRPARARRTETVSFVALLNYVICSLLVLAGVVVMMTGLRAGAQMDERIAQRSGRPSAVTGRTALGLYGLCLSTVPLAVAVAYGAAGYGVMDRRHWGRILTFILAGISVIPALGALVTFAMAAFITMISEDAGTPQLITLGISLVLTVLFAGYTACCFNILVREKYAAEFR